MPYTDKKFHARFVDESSKKFYDSSFYKNPTPEHLEIIMPLVPSNYSIRHKGAWIYLNSGKTLPEYGWKIHISATLSNRQDILKRVTSVLLDKNISFKFNADEKTFRFLNSKTVDRGNSGKFITIYPVDLDEFKEIIRELYELLREYDGPYILSDKRYKDCKVLYYRYGGIAPNRTINSLGCEEYRIKDGFGNQIFDQRKPYFVLPQGVEDPFPSPTGHNTSSIILQDRYLIKKAIHYSNRGGVYIAEDLQNNSTVVIKETRPHTFYIGEKDALTIAREETIVLEKLKNERIVKCIGSFTEWENYYLVMEFCVGVDLIHYIQYNHPKMNYCINSSTVSLYRMSCFKILTQIIDVLEYLYQSNVYIVDLSPNNILIDEDCSVKFIDFESTSTFDKESHPRYGTLGYQPYYCVEDSPKQKIAKSLGAICVSMIYPINNLLSVKELKDPEYEVLNQFGIFPEQFIEFTRKLLAGKLISYVQMRKLIEEMLNVDDETEYKRLSIDSKSLFDDEKIAKTLRNCIDLDGRYRYFPTDPMTYQTNPINLAHGISGALLLLNKMNMNTGDIISKLCLYPCNKETLSAGLFTGISGVIWSLLETNNNSFAHKWLEALNETDYSNYESGIYHGIAGIGLTYLKAYYRLKSDEYLMKARQIGDILIKRSLKEREGVCWLNISNQKALGYGSGASGIAMYFLYLHIATGEKRYLEIGEDALKFELGCLREKERMLPKGYSENKQVVSNYVVDGSSGLLMALVRYWHYTQKNKYKDWVDFIAPSINTQFMIFPGIMTGSCGLANTCLDLYQFTGEEKYLNWAFSFEKNLIHSNPIRDNSGGIFLWKSPG